MEIVKCSSFCVNPEAVRVPPTASFYLVSGDAGGVPDLVVCVLPVVTGFPGWVDAYAGKAKVDVHAHSSDLTRSGGFLWLGVLVLKLSSFLRDADLVFVATFGCFLDDHKSLRTWFGCLAFVNDGGHIW